MKRLILTVIAAVFCSACVNLDSGFLFREIGMGFVQKDGTILSDNGNSYTVTDNACEARFKDSNRILYSLEAITERPGKAYDVRLLQCYNVLYKDPVKLSEVTDPKSLGNDPIRVTDAWVSGGCLNMEVQLYVKIGSEVKHFLNLVCDEALTREDGTLDLMFTHNAGEDKIDEMDPSPDFYLAVTYVSFPLQKLCSPDGKIKAILRWIWGGDEEAVEFSTTIQ